MCILLARPAVAGLQAELQEHAQGEECWEESHVEARVGGLKPEPRVPGLSAAVALGQAASLGCRQMGATLMVPLQK